MKILALNSIIPLKGFVTQQGYLKGQNLLSVERLLGYGGGRLSKGAWFCELQQMPTIEDFNLAGYSQVAGHRFAKEFNTSEYDKDKNALFIRKKNAMAAWELSGRKSLVKVIPVIAHNYNMTDDDQYPAGEGIPQWNLVRELPFRVVSFVPNYTSARY